MERHILLFLLAGVAVAHDTIMNEERARSRPRMETDAQSLMQLSVERASDDRALGMANLSTAIAPWAGRHRGQKRDTPFEPWKRGHMVRTLLRPWWQRTVHEVQSFLATKYNIPMGVIAGLLSNKQIIEGILHGDATDALLELASQEKGPVSQDHRTDKLLQGHSLTFCNVFFVVMVCILIGLPLFGTLIEKRWPNYTAIEKRRWPLAVGLLILGSYICWFPAIFCRDFTFNLGIVLPQTHGYRIGLTSDRHDEGIAGPVRESTRSLIGLMAEKHKPFGAALVAVYAFAVPFLKIVFLALGEYFRFGPGRSRIQASRTCLQVMQSISKWAAPDMFAYCLLFYLLRHLDKMPISSLAIFDVGFASFSSFIVACAVSSAFVPLPELEDKQKLRVPFLMRYLRGSWLPFLACGLSICWGVLFVIGIITPCFALWITEEGLVAHAPKGVSVITKIVDLSRMIPRTEVSLWTATWTHFGYLLNEGDLNFFVAWIMLFVFAICTTVASMFCLLATAWQVRKYELGLEAKGATASAKGLSSTVGVADLLKHLAMTDVLIMGVIVCTVTMAMYQDYGLNCCVLNGLYVLLASEVIHYVTFHTIMPVAEFYCDSKEIATDAAADDNEDEKVAVKGD